MKKVIVYYSYRGNTKSIAEMIQKSTGADIARIETVVSYDGDYNSVVNQGQDEVNSGYCPKIKPLRTCRIWKNMSFFYTLLIFKNVSL